MEPPKITERATCTQTFYTTAPPQLRLHSNKQTKAIPRTNRRRANYRNHCRVADITPTIIVATEVWTPHQPPSTGPGHRCQAPKTKPSRGNTTPRRRHRPITDQCFLQRDQNDQIRTEGVGEQATMPPRRSTTATAAAIAGHGTRPRHGFHQVPHHLSRTSSCIDIS